MSCNNKLSWYELVPLLSFCALLGRCRKCKTRISAQYPAVELTAGLIFAALFLKFQDIFLLNTGMFAITFAFYALEFSILIVIATYDFKHKIIPDSLVFVFGALAFVGLFFFPLFYGHVPTIFEFFSGIFIALPFVLLWFVSEGEWMGLGDAKLALGIGWLLPFSLALSALAVAFWAGALVGLCLVIASKNYGMKSEIPFALYLFFGTLLVFLLELHIFPI